MTTTTMKQTKAEQAIRELRKRLVKPSEEWEIFDRIGLDHGAMEEEGLGHGYEEPIFADGSRLTCTEEQYRRQGSLAWTLP
jgi:hypothetical protein